MSSFLYIIKNTFSFHFRFQRWNARLCLKDVLFGKLKNVRNHEPNQREKIGKFGTQNKSEMNNL